MAVRLATADDASAFGHFDATLGYPVTEAQARRRIKHIHENTCGAIYVFFEQSLLKGWVHIHAVPLLASEGYAEIGGLAVADPFRRQGVGKALIAACVDWARTQGFNRLRLYSSTHRTEAHAFYKALGFDSTKAPAFTLQISQGTAANIVI
jgi:GNAT superfamily N-acetyltransferase